MLNLIPPVTIISKYYLDFRSYITYNLYNITKLDPVMFFSILLPHQWNADGLTQDKFDAYEISTYRENLNDLFCLI